MVTGASTADLSVILIDARKGVLTQTRRHGFLVSLLGIRHVVLVVNKMDLVDYSREVFTRIEDDYRQFAGQMASCPRSPASPSPRSRATTSSSVPSAMPWYRGPDADGPARRGPGRRARGSSTSRLRLPVQWVNRPNPDFRGFAGTLVAGQLRKGEAVRVQPSGRMSRVARLVTADGDLERAVVGQSITVTLEDEVDVSRGDLIVAAREPAEVADEFEATLVWMNEAPLLPGRGYLMKIGPKTVTATVNPLKYKINVNTFGHMAAPTLELNEIGVVQSGAGPSHRVRRLQDATATPAGSSSSIASRTIRSAPGCCTSRSGAPRTSSGRRST